MEARLADPMPEWIDVASSTEVPLNGTACVKIGLQKFLLIRSEAGLFALEDKCPHQEQTMAGGLVTPKGIECPWHSVKVELSSGKVLNDMGFVGLPPVKVFPVEEKDGRISVKTVPGIPSRNS